MDGFAFEKKKVDSVRKSRGSSLSQGFAAFDINGDSQAHGRGHPGLVVPPLGNCKYPICSNIPLYNRMLTSSQCLS